MTRTRLTHLIEHFWLVLPVFGVFILASQLRAETPGAGSANALTSFERALAAAEGDAKALNARARDLYAALDDLLSLKLSDPGRQTGDGLGSLPEELKLASQIAWLKEYKGALIHFYDLVADETPAEKRQASGLPASLNASLAGFERNTRDMVTARAQLPPGALPAGSLERAHAIESLSERLRRAIDPDSGVFTERGDTTLVLGRTQFLAPAGAAPGGPRTFPAALHATGDDMPDASDAVIVLDNAFLVHVQNAIDPVEQRQFELEYRRESERLKSVERQGAPEPAAAPAENGPAAAGSELSHVSSAISSFKTRREKMIEDVARAYQSAAAQARAIGDDLLPDELLKEETLGIALRPDTRDALREEMEDLLAQLPARKGADLLAIEVQLAAELVAWEIRLAALDNAGIEHATLAMQYRAKDRRLTTLRAAIRRNRAQVQVSRALTANLIFSVVAIEQRIDNLRQRWRMEAVTFYGLGAAKVLLILAGAWLLIRLCSFLSVRVIKRLKASERFVHTEGGTEDQSARFETLRSVFMATVRVAAWVIAGLMILGQFEINYEPLLLATGGITLAIGFGAQSLVKDFVSGFFMLLENQFTVNDVIEANGKTGTVEAVNLRTTRLRGADGTLHIIPNGNVSMVSNMSHEWSRMVVVVGVAYTEDPDDVTRILNRVGTDMYDDPAWKKVLLEAPTVLGVDNFGSSSIDIRVWGKTWPGEQWNVAREFRRRVKIAFDRARIEIPFTYMNIIQTQAKPSKVLGKDGIN